MIFLKNENLKELTEKILDLLALTSVEIGHRTDAKTLATLSKIFATDLMIEKAFRLGVRFGKDEPFMNIRTFYKWVYSHKKEIDNAMYEVHTLGKDPAKTLYYPDLKLLK